MPLLLLALLTSPTVNRPPTGDKERPAPRADAIRAVDLNSLFTGELGAVSTRELSYADLTGDGLEEAIVPLDSKGSAADVAIAVYGYDEAGLLRPLLLHQGQHLAFKVEQGKLVITEPLYGPKDPNCCPSGSTVMTYAWNGRALVLQSKHTGPAPRGAR